MYCRMLPPLERCSAVMQGQFPVLRTLSLGCCVNGRHASVAINSFLGGYAPRLQKITLFHVPFLTLPNLLLSAKNLVKFHLNGTTGTGYISPDALATCFSMLKRLEYIDVRFPFYRSFPRLTNRPPPPLTRAVLPALKRFEFEGVCKYSEDLIARIDAPLLRTFSLDLFQQPNFDISQVPQFLRRVEIFNPPYTADIVLFDDDIKASLESRGCNSSFQLRLKFGYLVTPLLLVEQILTQCLPLTSQVYHLYLCSTTSPGPEDSALWLRVLRLFTAVQVLDVIGDVLGLDIAHTLSDLEVSSAADVLPMLHTIVLHAIEEIGPMVTPLFRPFLDARKLSDRPVAIVEPRFG